MIDLIKLSFNLLQKTNIAMIKITGKTYPHASFMRSLRALYDPLDKSWKTPSVTVQQLAYLRSLPDVVVDGDAITPIITADELAASIASIGAKR